MILDSDAERRRRTRRRKSKKIFGAGKYFFAEERKNGEGKIARRRDIEEAL